MTATTTEATEPPIADSRPVRAAAVIPAAGQARRFGSGKNKIWVELAGRTVLERTLAAFAAHPAIATLAVVAGKEEIEAVRAVAARFPKVCAVVPGGATRALSVRNGVEALPSAIEVVLVHDAARPLVSAEVIQRVLDASVAVGGAVPGLPLSDTVKRMGSDGLVRETVARSVVVEGETLSGLTAVQTPQGARLSLLKAAYAAYDFAASEPTDEASLLEAHGVSVQVVLGDPRNIKITRPEDVALAERFLSAYPEIRTGFGYDVHRFAAPEAGRKLFLGGVEIPHDRGLDGHSDADVLLHAVCDALLGAASLGDIGILFPNTDERFRNISSLKLLAEVQRELSAAGWEIVNLDATLLAEAPKLMPHRLAIQQTIADCLGIAPACVSVKATTSEQLGFVGRKEGMACWAVATVRTR